jgi:ABC-type nitrate/sulfonate/bicarbonate transport system permease component
MHRFRVVRRSLHPWLVASQAVPTPVLAPALALWLGYSLSTRAVVVALVAFFPIAVATADGLARADRELLDLYASLDASRARTLLDVELPSALPALFSGLRVGAAFAVVGAVFGEWVGSTGGLGYLLLVSSNRLQTDLVLACVVVLAALALLLVGTCTAAERALTPWRRP